jgi:hypothetical protein
MIDNRNSEYIMLSDDVLGTGERGKAKKVENKRVLSRKANLEENSFFLFNICYCFFCPFVCSRKALDDEDIPDCSVKDKTATIYPKIKKKWENNYRKYIKEMEEYERKKELNMNNDKKNEKIKIPKKPSLLGALCGSLVSGSLIFALLLLLLRYMKKRFFFFLFIN